ncbi:DUF695 domain-containing protein [Dactylosporangium sp. AC04546]|uniref:DUF695 domain-containing protein n=1 Tax=Dactylosporangium sp. AC04546 TaxID=2862460 RepID=UPI001EE0529C|nr:DUF695 domain-containing protein [Dactylosporangium sp. AC04546]WVK81744.1 DUF695 domain-containing protein [Dactylosporangium sp. AC04546]
MIFSRRKKAGGGQQAIVDFWTWWPDARPRVEAAISSGDWSALTGEVGSRVAAVHKDLTWEFSRGTGARHALVVSSGGDPALRSVAARWRALAPADDPDWEYHTARQPDFDTLQAKIGIGGAELDLSELRIAFTRDPDRPEVDVVVFHPRFAVVPEAVRGQVSFLVLDWVLGENGVEEWVGAVEWTTDEPDGAADPLRLAEAVADLRAEYREPQWVVFSGSRRGAPLTGLAQRPLRSVRWPRFDTHVAVTLPYAAEENGLPDDETLDGLREFEDTVLAAALDDGELLVVETSAGERTLHYYVDGATPAADALIAAARRWPRGRAERGLDPSFEAIAQFR